MTLPPAEPYPWLHDLAWLRQLARTLADEHDAEDAVQDTFVAALQSGPDDDGSRRPWLATVLRNFALRARQRGASRAARERASARDDLLPSTAALVERVQVQRGVGDAVLALDEPYRRAILLRFFEDLPPRVIARELGVPVNTVRTRIQRGLQMLRARLDREHGGRAAWTALCLPVLEPGAATAAVPAGSVGAGSVFAGVLLMSTAHKLTLAAAALVVVAVPFAVWPPWVAAPDAPAPARDTGGGAAVAAGNADSPKVAPAARADSERVVVADAAPRFAVCGRLVEDRTGQPVAGAEVVLAHRYARGPDEPRTVSDEAGRFAVELMEGMKENPGRLPGDVLVEAADFAPFHQSLPRQEILESTGDRFDLGVLRLPRGARVTGRVVRQADGAPVAGAHVLWTDVAAMQGWFLPAHGRDAGTTGADGTFALRERLPPTPDWEHTLFAVGENGLGWASLAIAGDCERTEVTIRVPATGVLKVHVTDAKQQPVRDARVQALPLFEPVGPGQSWLEERAQNQWIGGAAQVQALFVAATDADGNAALPRLAGGRYWVSATHDGHHPARKRGVRVEPGRATDVALELQPVVAVTIQGRVVDRSRRPIANATLTNRSDRQQPIARSGADGRFELGPVSVAGDLALEVSADGYSVRWERIDLGKYDAAAPVEIVLARIHTLTGRIVDQDGIPVAGANPFVQSGGQIVDEGGAPKTGDDGAFTLRVACEDDDLELVAMPPEPRGHWQPGEPVAVRAGDAQQLELRLLRPAPGHATLTVRVTGPDGVTPIEPQRASLFPAADPLGGTTRFGIAAETGRGRVTARDLATGVYELSLAAIGGGRARTTFRVGPDDREVELHVAIGPPGRIVGRVVFDDVPAELRTGRLFLVVDPHQGHQLGADGKPAEGITDGCAFVDAAGDGHFVLGDITTGAPVQLRLVQRDPLIGTATVTVPPSGEATMELRLQVGARVHFASSAPLPAGRYVIEVATGGEGFRVVHADQLKSAVPLDVDLLLRPGAFRWRLTGRIANVGEGERTITAEGEAVADRERPQTVIVTVAR